MIRQSNEDWVNRRYFSDREGRSFARSGECRIKAFDKERHEAIFIGRTEEHITSMLGCSCPDYARVGAPVPCKHMFRLARELGFFPDGRILSLI